MNINQPVSLPRCHIRSITSKPARGSCSNGAIECAKVSQLCTMSTSKVFGEELFTLADDQSKHLNLSTNHGRGGYPIVRMKVGYPTPFFNVIISPSPSLPLRI